MRRAAVSIPANIAERLGRQHKWEFLQHLAIAKDSLTELHTLLIVAQKLGYQDEAQLRQWEEHLSQVCRPLAGLMATLNTNQPLLPAQC